MGAGNAGRSWIEEGRGDVVVAAGGWCKRLRNCERLFWACWGIPVATSWKKSAPHATPNQFPLKAKANQGQGGEEEKEGQAASPERFLKITKLLSICSRGRNSNNNNGMSLTTINHGRLSGRVAAWVCLVGVHRRLWHCMPARLIVLCLRLQRCFIFALNFASLTC